SLRPPPSFPTRRSSDLVFAYLRTVPKISRMVDRGWKQATSDDAGRAAYVNGGCNTCHGDDGIGYYSLKRVNETFPNDDQLKAFRSEEHTSELQSLTNLV